MSSLVVLSGLPGVGKTTIARAVGAETGAVHLRIDTIEAALSTSGIVERAGGWESNPDAGYRVAYAVAGDLLRAGHDVVADSVNPLGITRTAWAAVADAAHANLIDVEVTCVDRALHRRRVEERVSDLEGLTVPTWAEVVQRRYEPRALSVLRVDTSAGIETAVGTLVAAIRASVEDTGV
ncbi:AAA family ATPase [Millisia brevis]|uniref:AAA family ATPase n=1 Tax=Millisia brevis TaxID=264148 RepID=UPI0009FE056B|nr:AAA family ATPase [Millisia brevis]